MLNKNHLIHRTIMLSSVTLIARLLGFFYKVILSILIGAQGIGLYQMVFPVLMLFITISASGIPITVSKLIAKQRPFGKTNQKILKNSIILTFIISLFLSILLISSSKLICTSILKNPIIHTHLLFLAPAIIIISISSVLKSYFYGMKMIKPSSVSQILEQVSRIVFVLGYLYYLYPIDPRLGSLIAIIGLLLGEATGLLCMISFYTKYKSSHTGIKYVPLGSNFSMKISQRLLTTSAPITISRLISSILQFANAIIIPQQLMKSGLSNTESISVFGRLTGMAMPLIFFPFIVIASLSINIIPNISQNLSIKNYNKIKSDTRLAIKTTLLITLPVTVLFFLYADNLGIFFYKDALVGKCIRGIGYSTVFLALTHITSSILLGLGKQIISTVNHVLGITIQLAITYFLIAYPTIRINGFFIGIFVGSVIITLLNIISLSSIVSIKNIYGSYIPKILFASVSMLIAHKVYFILINNFNFSTTSLSNITCSILCIVTYVFFIIVMGCVHPKSFFGKKKYGHRP